MRVSADVERIVDAALEGARPTHSELVHLASLDAYSLDAAYTIWAGRTLTAKASNGVAEIHAQVGMDANPCPDNCLFCSFAAVNTTRTGRMEMPVEQVIAYAKAYIEQGANCLTFMVTSNYDFGQYVDYLAQVREAVGPSMPLCANMGDFTFAQAQRLKAAGVGSVYHAVRNGEGVLTNIPLERRFESIHAAQEAGLKVLTCLELCIPRFSEEEIVTNMERVLDCRTEYAHAGSLVRVPGTAMQDEPVHTLAKRNLYKAVMRLGAGTKSRFGCGNLTWAEVGTNPRDHSNETEKTGIASSVDKIRRRFESEGWKTYRGPSPWW